MNRPLTQDCNLLALKLKNVKENAPVLIKSDLTKL